LPDDIAIRRMERLKLWPAIARALDTEVAS
jgi:hypothetical protein